MKRRRNRDSVPSDEGEKSRSATSVAVIARDGGRCKVAPFLPDMPCSGPLTIFTPDDVDESDPSFERAVTSCETHLAWVRANLAASLKLGLVRDRGTAER